MNYKTLVPVLFLIMFHSYNVMAQGIKIKIDKLKYGIDEPISITYTIEKKIDSAGIEGKNFTVESGPDTSTKSNYSEVSFSLKAIRPGRLRLPRVTMYSQDGVIKSNDMFVEIIDKEFTSEDLKLVTYKAGHTFNISLPVYMSKTSGINSYSAMEYKSEKNDVRGYIIYDHKKNNNLPESYAVNDYYEAVIKDYMTYEEQRKVSAPEFLKKGPINFIETDMTIFDTEKKKTIYYFIGIAETNKAFYRIISWTPEENKTKVKTDFQNILYSIKD
ncbi:protein BatD [Flavobacterium sp. ov086]|uniref:protein BatD n=1 Tax=Flavobacterium sp. ov086 TaxID=1761785 RepID=UPI000B70F4A9|nr:protein BatD [Flavobacterium sp. ov086]SNR40083.1 hypothetical protein SAMN04487979_10512 [Flavobacterium sp. ov086]